MKNKLFIGILIVIFIAILSFIIPIRKEEKDVWHVKGPISYGHRANCYFNIYGIKVWPYYEHISEYDI